MMSLSQTTGYAIQALACLETARPCSIREVADSTRLPRAYLARIINRLAHRGIIIARRGYRGGIQLARPPGNISLLDVVESVEGPDWIGPCLLGIPECGSRFLCPTRKFWLKIRRWITNKLRTTTMEDVVKAKGFKSLMLENARRMSGDSPVSGRTAGRARKPSKIGRTR
jgi:Rrf2 family protein